MAIPIMYPCGRIFRLKDHLAGRKIQCPDCFAILRVPQLQLFEDPWPEYPDVVPQSAPSEPQGQPPDSYPADERGGLAPAASSPLVKRPSRAKRRKRRARARRVASGEGWFGSINAGVIGGALMILIAVVWFVGGLMVGFIFFYPPILLNIGLIALGRGLASET